jgi:TPP-dependent indolepyruvate ferredoxin oxidoreductase alpha subunit
MRAVSKTPDTLGPATIATTAIGNNLMVLSGVPGSPVGAVMRRIPLQEMTNTKVK